MNNAPTDGQQIAKPFYKKWWIWVVMIVFLYTYGQYQLDNVDKMQKDKQLNYATSTTSTPTTTVNNLVENSNTQPKQQIITVSAKIMTNEYAANEIAADQKYKDHAVEITGVISEISKDVFGKYYVTLDGDSTGYMNVRCYFIDSYQDKLAKLQKNTQVKFIGFGSGKVIDVTMKDCQI